MSSTYKQLDCFENQDKLAHHNQQEDNNKQGDNLFVEYCMQDLGHDSIGESVGNILDDNTLIFNINIGDNNLDNIQYVGLWIGQM